MKHILIFFFVLLSSLTFSKGAQGTYTIVGIAYGADSVSLKNVELSVKIGDKTTIVKTNEYGHYKIEVKWSTVCETKLTEAEIKEETKKMNPEYIYVSYKGKEVKIKNEWEKYSKMPEARMMKSKDLHF